MKKNVWKKRMSQQKPEYRPKWANKTTNKRANTSYTKINARCSEMIIDKTIWGHSVARNKRWSIVFQWRWFWFMIFAYFAFSTFIRNNLFEFVCFSFCFFHKLRINVEYHLEYLASILESDEWMNGWRLFVCLLECVH